MTTVRTDVCKPSTGCVWKEAQEENQQRADLAADPTHIFVQFWIIDRSFLREKCLSFSSVLLQEIDEGCPDVLPHTRILRGSVGAMRDINDGSADAAVHNLCDSLDAFIAAREIDFRRGLVGQLDEYTEEVVRHAAAVSEAINQQLLVPALKAFVNMGAHSEASMMSGSLPKWRQPD